MLVGLWILNVICILLIFSSVNIYKKKMNPISIIMSIYLIWTWLGYWGLYNQYKPTYNSTVFILSNIVWLCVCCIMSSIGVHKTIHFVPLNLIKKPEQVLSGVRIISFLISIAIFLNLVRTILSGNLLLSNVRYISYSVAFESDAYATIYFNSRIYYLYQYIIRGFAFFDMAYSTCLLIVKKRAYKILTIVNFALFAIIMQSRIEILKLVIFICIVIAMKGMKLNSTQKKYFKRTGIVLVVLVIAVASIRTKLGTNFVLHSIESFIIDFSGSNYTFSKYFSEFNAGLRLSNSSFFHELFGGFALLFDYVKLIFGFGSSSNAAVSQYLGKGISIGSSATYNCFYTMYFEFLDVGGFFGCFLFSTVFGSLIGYFYRNFVIKESSKSIYLSAMMIYGAVIGTYNFVFSTIASTILFLGLFLQKDD